MPLTILFPTKPLGSGSPTRPTTTQYPMPTSPTSSLSGSNARCPNTQCCGIRSTWTIRSRPRRPRRFRTKPNGSKADLRIASGSRKQWRKPSLRSSSAERGWRRLRCFRPQNHRGLGSAPLGHDSRRLEHYRVLAHRHRDDVAPARSRLRGPCYQRPPHLPPASRRRAGRRLGRCAAGTARPRGRLDGAASRGGYPRRGSGVRLRRAGVGDL